MTTQIALTGLISITWIAQICFALILDENGTARKFSGGTGSTNFDGLVAIDCIAFFAGVDLKGTPTIVATDYLFVILIAEKAVHISLGTRMS
jgi:hypothetical protein